MTSILHHLLPGHVMDKVKFLACIRKGSIRKAESWGKYWTYFRIRPYVILRVGEAVHGRVMCLHQVLGLRSAGPVLELCAKWERPVASWSLQGWASVHMDVSLPPRPQCSCRPAEGWNIFPSMELPTNPTHESERLKVIWRELKERELAYFFFFYFFLFFIFYIVVDFVIHWNETDMGLHVFPFPFPPPPSLCTRAL